MDQNKIPVAGYESVVMSLIFCT